MLPNDSKTMSGTLAPLTFGEVNEALLLAENEENKLFTGFTTNSLTGKWTKNEFATRLIRTFSRVVISIEGECDLLVAYDLSLVNGLTSTVAYALKLCLSVGIPSKLSSSPLVVELVFLEISAGGSFPYLTSIS